MRLRWLATASRTSNSDDADEQAANSVANSTVGKARAADGADGAGQALAQSVDIPVLQAH